jgi:hypothetical protein
VLPRFQIRPMCFSELGFAAQLTAAEGWSAKRCPSFLKRRFESFPKLGWVMEKEGNLSGFILRRCGDNWVSAGPLVLAVEPTGAVPLLESFACCASGNPISIGVLASNRRAGETVKSRGFQERHDNPWQMVCCHHRFIPFSSSHLGCSVQSFAVGSAAKG